MLQGLVKNRCPRVSAVIEAVQGQLLSHHGRSGDVDRCLRQSQPVAAGSRHDQRHVSAKLAC